MAQMNFGRQSNGKICTCGEHHGQGECSPGKRAAIYARIRDNIPQYLEPHQSDYLRSFEAQHGPVKWELRDMGKVSRGPNNNPNLNDFLPQGAIIFDTICTSYTDQHDATNRLSSQYQPKQLKNWTDAA